MDKLLLRTLIDTFCENNKNDNLRPIETKLRELHLQNDKQILLKPFIDSFPFYANVGGPSLKTKQRLVDNIPDNSDLISLIYNLFNSQNKPTSFQHDSHINIYKSMYDKSDSEEENINGDMYNFNRGNDEEEFDDAEYEEMYNFDEENDEENEL